MFVGRTDELSSLAAELDLARSGNPRVILIDGEAGMGKSRLVRQFLRSQADVRVLRGSGAEDELLLPYGVVDQLVSSPGVEAAGSLEGADDPLAVGARLVQLLGELQRGGPVALVVDDVHWADVPSLRALTFALRRLHVDSVLAVITSRPDEAHLPEGLRRLVADRGRKIRLGGLMVAELRALAAAMGIAGLSRASLARLREHTGGNPLHVRTLLEELDPDVLRRHTGPLPAPRSFRPLVAGRLASLGPDARALVQAAAVLGQRCQLDLACRLAQTADPSVALDEALRAHFLVLVDQTTGREIAFAHPLLRAAVYHDLGPVECSRLHLAAAALLPDPWALEHRAASAFVPDVAIPRELVTLADQESSEGAWATASSHLLLAAGLQPDPSERDVCVLRAVEVLLEAGDVAEATSLARDQLAGMSDSPRRRFVLGLGALFRAEYREAESLLTSTWDTPDTGPSAEVRAKAADARSLAAVMLGRPAEALLWAGRAMDANPAQVDTFACAVLAARSELAGLPPNLHTAAGEGLGVRTGRGVARCWTGQLQAARTDLTAVVDATGSRPASVLALLARGYLAEVEYRQGHWDDAVVRADVAVSLATDAGQTWLLPTLWSIASLVPAARGQWEQTESAVLVAGQAAADCGDAASLLYARTAEAFLAFCASDPRRVLRTLGPLRRQPPHPSTVEWEPGLSPWLELYAQALIDQGELAEATTAVEDLASAAALNERPVAAGVAARLRGSLAAAQGDATGAAAAFQQSVRQLAGFPVPFERAMADYAYGRFLRRTGSRRAAAARLQAAGHGFAALSATPFVERADRELAASGLTPRTRLSPTIALTPQELAVARLVASRRTNKEVAEALIVSVKTVEYHLSHVYAKLGLRSRTELAARLGALPHERSRAPQGRD